MPGTTFLSYHSSDLYCCKGPKAIRKSSYKIQRWNQHDQDELLISPLILKGQPFSHIFTVHVDEIPVCRRTLYNYLDQQIFQARNIDLPRRVRYKKRKKTSAPRNNNIQEIYRNKRTYIDFERFLEAHPGIDVVETNTVKGGRAAGKCLLNLLFRSCSFMLVIILPIYGILGYRQMTVKLNHEINSA